MKTKIYSQVKQELKKHIEKSKSRMFEVPGFDGTFDLYTVEFMRGHYGLQQDEEYGQYFLSYHENKRSGISIEIDVKPTSNRFIITEYTKKKRKEENDYENERAKLMAFLILTTIMKEDT